MVNAGVAPSDDIDYLLNDFTNLLNGFGWESESTKEGASTSAIDENKLVKNGGFVASSSQESVCLEEPQAGDKLIRQLGWLFRMDLIVQYDKLEYQVFLEKKEVKKEI
ncbi:hypothetical protein CFP56_036345 [Quercus suber]|uniref:Uncharacterized protein n=1 Tax=Quercus suber TaxID=58331 RepID=A0AAW0J6X3_QUESU